jgi:hypothetical protein
LSTDGDAERQGFDFEIFNTDTAQA